MKQTSTDFTPEALVEMSDWCQGNLNIHRILLTHPLILLYLTNKLLLKMIYYCDINHFLMISIEFDYKIIMIGKIDTQQVCQSKKGDKQ